MSSVVFEKLQQLIFDENKIVTYKLLTKLLKINVNIARNHLQEFFDSHRKELGAFYILIGIQSNEKNQIQFTKVNLVSSDELESSKKSFTSVTSAHIYCVHKEKIVDKLALFADCEAGDTTQNLSKYSAIRNPHIHIRPSRKILKAAPLATKVENKSQQQPPKPKVESKTNDENDVQKKSPVTSNVKKSDKKDEKASNSKNKSPGIASLFQKKHIENKSNDQKQTTKNDSVAKKPDKNAENQAGKSKEGKQIQNLFSRQIEKGTALKANPNEESKVHSPEAKKSALDESISKKGKNADGSGKKGKNQRVSMKQKKKSDSDSDDAKPKRKKHKRIVAMDETDSESENEELADKAQRELVMCEPDIYPHKDSNVTPSEEIVDEDDDDDCIPPTPVTGKKKVWKLVTKTFMDDSGFFVTKKTKEYATASDESANEDDKKSKPPAPKETVNKASFANKKQASLTSFFRQK